MKDNQEKAKKSISKKNLAIIIVAIVLVAAVALFVSLKLLNPQKTQAGAKTITVEVIGRDGVPKEFVINTDEEFLRGALEQENLISGEEGEYGLFVKTVDGETADASCEWWCFTQDGEMLMTGVDGTPISDGDHFEITLSAF